MRVSLFPVSDLPRKARVKRMYIADAGHIPGGKIIRFLCPRCKHDTGWIPDTRTISANRKGIACPVCNPPLCSG